MTSATDMLSKLDHTSMQTQQDHAAVVFIERDNTGDDPLYERIAYQLARSLEVWFPRMIVLENSGPIPVCTSVILRRISSSPLFSSSSDYPRRKSFEVCLALIARGESFLSPISVFSKLENHHFPNVEEMVEMVQSYVRGGKSVLAPKVERKLVDAAKGENAISSKVVRPQSARATSTCLRKSFTCPQTARSLTQISTTEARRVYAMGKREGTRNKLASCWREKKTKVNDLKDAAEPADGQVRCEKMSRSAGRRLDRVDTPRFLQAAPQMCRPEESAVNRASDQEGNLALNARPPILKHQDHVAFSHRQRRARLRQREGEEKLGKGAMVQHDMVANRLVLQTQRTHEVVEHADSILRRMMKKMSEGKINRDEVNEKQRKQAARTHESVDNSTIHADRKMYVGTSDRLKQQAMSKTLISERRGESSTSKFRASAETKKKVWAPVLAECAVLENTKQHEMSWSEDDSNFSDLLQMSDDSSSSRENCNQSSTLTTSPSQDPTSTEDENVENATQMVKNNLRTTMRGWRLWEEGVIIIQSCLRRKLAQREKEKMLISLHPPQDSRSRSFRERKYKSSDPNPALRLPLDVLQQQQQQQQHRHHHQSGNDVQEHSYQGSNRSRSANVDNKMFPSSSQTPRLQLGLEKVVETLKRKESNTSSKIRSLELLTVLSLHRSNVVPIYLMEVQHQLYAILREVDGSTEESLKKVCLACEILENLQKHSIVRQKIESDGVVTIVLTAMSKVCGIPDVTIKLCKVLLSVCGGGREDNLTDITSKKNERELNSFVHQMIENQGYITLFSCLANFCNEDADKEREFCHELVLLLFVFYSNLQTEEYANIAEKVREAGALRTLQKIQQRMSARSPSTNFDKILDFVMSCVDVEN
uniref:Uncharacterized protein n=2 Tax=Hanusia phi TaxID=3032 RepID=A0A7S0HKT0_9CRYP|mmetsp:Transcript_25996/g.58802  ORF Transcript_25996/g.58802 Transcript_25996/m.58802 type:complete len:878 (+) Transcript_25996:116-2749(+)